VDTPSQESFVTFGFPEEWKDFASRNQVFLTRFPQFMAALETAFKRKAELPETIDRFVFLYGRLCWEDFLEILLCSGNGYGRASEKLLRGLYERAVTLRYLHEHPTKIEAYFEFNSITQHRFLNACKKTIGNDFVPPEMADEIEENYEKVKDKFLVTECEKCGTQRTNHTWSKLDFVSMAYQTNLGQLIVSGYYGPLRQAHATLGATMSRLIVEDNGNIAFDESAQRKPAGDSLRMAHLTMLNVLEVQQERFNLPSLRQEIDSCYQDFQDIWEKKRS
jgi:hypothetical protein